MGGVRRIELLSLVLSGKNFVLISSRSYKSGRTIWVCSGLSIGQIFCETNSYVF